MSSRSLRIHLSASDSNIGEAKMLPATCSTCCPKGAVDCRQELERRWFSSGLVEELAWPGCDLRWPQKGLTTTPDWYPACWKLEVIMHSNPQKCRLRGVSFAVCIGRPIRCVSVIVKYYGDTANPAPLWNGWRRILAICFKTGSFSPYWPITGTAYNTLQLLLLLLLQFVYLNPFGTRFLE